MKVVLISDTHGLHERVVLPEGDLLIHAGDFTNVGEPWDVERFATWFSKTAENYKHGAVLIAGNHDISMDEQNYAQPAYDAQTFSGFHYLNDSGVTINGFNIWGSPVTPSFGYGWAFNRLGLEIKPHWKRIPDNTNILITHGPPFSVLDTPGGTRTSVGCPYLRNRTTELAQLKLHVFGHIHGSYGVSHGEHVMVNASQVDEAYRVTHAPVIIDL
jgi:Icc-related predicted phosphoesterase